jgi:RimJ/RimL family protein N-acetyltransferase
VTPPTLETERLVLRPFAERDLDAFAAMYADPEVVRHLGDGRPLDRAATWRTMAVFVGHWELRGYGQWALVEKAGGDVIGRAGLWHPEGWPGLEAGWLLDRARWGRGLATEAARAALDWAFEVLGAAHVVSVIAPANVRSIRVAERIGETYERRIALDTPAVAGPIDVAIYGIARDRWTAGKRA